MIELDFRSDTVTLPTEEMLKAMAKAELGNDAWGEDPTVNRLLKMAMEITGKEAALLVVSGTAGNLLGAMTHLETSGRGGEVILEESNHVYWYEASWMSHLLGLSIRSVKTGSLSPEIIFSMVRPKNKYFPQTQLLWLENSYMLNGGTVYSSGQMEEIYKAAKEKGLVVHLDGARLFNAAVALGCEAAELTKWCDSVTFCLSKGLSCPLGSVLCGTREYIEIAKRNRIMIGGTMRQSGIIAAAGIVALEKMVDRLKDDHANARYVAMKLDKLTSGSVDLAKVQTNMVLIDPKAFGTSAEKLQSSLAQEKIQTLITPDQKIRAVFHRHITQASITIFLRAFEALSA